ncbi:MAG: BrxA/BrxB family bacilliredoxin [Melioribacteraceae bacterium]|nr:BrxA/BrxB family bacilliredoxin [Melioribacteraceae bacterium]
MEHINSKPPIYDPIAIQPMRDELIYVGFEELLTPNDVESKVSVNDGESKLIFLNSVCGCSAGSARPGIALALQNSKIPNKLYTSFAGNDRDSVDTIRENYFTQYAPSSPAIAIIKNGETVYFMGRPQIIDKLPEVIANELISEFEKIDGKAGPSITEEKYGELVHAISCGSKIPLN